MLQYRSFRNTDPPALATIWRSRRGQPGVWQPVSCDLFEQFVFGKPYFDAAGLIVAWEDDRPVGFAHAAFGPNETEDAVSTDLGVICMLMVSPDTAEADEVAAGLLRHCEAYLRGRGAMVLYGGAIRPLIPFYSGLYGGSEMPGVLQSDTLACRAFAAGGYREIDRTWIFRREVATFKTPITRDQIQLRRGTVVEVTVDPPSRSWWDACTTGEFDMTRVRLVPRGGGPAMASALLRNLEPTGVGAPSQAVGLVELEVATDHRRRGVAVFLVGEIFRHLARQGVGMLEVQTMQHNTAGVALYRKLGFESVDQGIVFRKDAD